jgi:hypothetical protein
LRFNTSITPQYIPSRSNAFSVRCFANKQPTFATLSYSTTGQTNIPVIATLSFNTTGITLTDATGRIPTNAEGENNVRQKTFPANATETLTRTDTNGTTENMEIFIDRIDTTPPTATLEYSTTGTTNQPVEVTLTLNKTGTVAMT